MKRVTMMLSLLVLGLHLSFVHAHPQCLDFYPPFELPSDSQPFCDGYKDFGCCTLTQNEAIRERYQTLKRNLPESAAHECRNFLKDILCQECSPYAAHLFDAETTHRKTPLPGLCGGYCSSLYNTCPELIPLVTDDAAIIDAHNTNESAFCAAVEIGDMDYCYPNILQDTFLDDLAWDARSGGGDGCLCFEEFANGLRNPVLAVHANDSTHRLFIAEQVGIVHVYLRNGTRLNDPFLDIQDTVKTSSRRGDERGFLGLAFHPNFVHNSRLFVYYSTLSSSESEIIRISEFQTMSNDSNRVNMTTESVILNVEQPAGNHNGGQMLFDDQGYFYAFLGDGGRGGDPFGQYGNAQNLAELLGSVIRIDVDQQQEGLAYAIPPGNPYVSYNNSERRHEIYAYGTRNMWRCSIDQGDRQTGEGRGRIFCGDVGQHSYEEIDIIEKGGNYGWRGKEGFSCYDNTMCNDFLENEVLPIHAYPHTIGKSVIGGYVYRGCQYPNLNGKYIFGDYVSGRLFELNENTATQEWNSREFCLGDNTVCTGSMLGSFPKNILSFGEDEAGEMYLLSTSEAKTTVPQGKVFKIVDPRKRGNPEECLKDIRDVDVHGPTTPFEPSPSGSAKCVTLHPSHYMVMLCLALLSHVCIHHLLVATPTSLHHYYHPCCVSPPTPPGSVVNKEGSCFDPDLQKPSGALRNAKESTLKWTIPHTAMQSL
ncbi:HHIP-like protein 2 isoform X3 [Strongylocentrotus purpuratus]|uniref:HHIP-like protein 1 n=1 Tax=Strongylocentrotus purpuratus TaxID=7668 RepID=A0A7M7PRZ3_STRPU|nr:HHIP-like protein 2 isoform X3 [Strongylocentrotus purpuratus]